MTLQNLKEEENTSMSSDISNIEKNNITKPKKKKRNLNLCHYVEGDCTKKQSMSIGLCKWCQKTFCINHRLPESHNCIGLQNCKKQAFEINKKKIGNEKCYSGKVTSI